MRKFWKFIIGGLQQKVFNAVLLALFIVSLSILVVISVQTAKLRVLLLDANAKQRESTEKVTSSFIKTSVLEDEEYKNQLMAFAVNSAFQNTAQKVKVFADIVEDLLQSELEMNYVPVPEPDVSTEGIASVKMLHAEDVSMTNIRVSSKVGALGNLSATMVSFFNNGGLDSCFIGLPEGVFLIADTNSAEKLDENGKPTPMDPRTRPWYIGAMDKDGVFFSDLMRDYFTGEVGIVCACPVYVNGKLEAVVGADIFLGTLDQWVNSSNTEGGFSFILNREGHVIFSPFTDGILAAKDASEASDLRTSSNIQLSEFVNFTLNGSVEARLVSLSGTAYYLTGSMMDTVGWAVVSAINRDNAFSLVSVIEKSFDSITENATADFAKGIVRTRTTIIVVLGIVFLITSTGSVLLGRKIVGPMNKMTKHISDLRDGDFIFKMDDVYKTGDEIEVLAKAFEDLSIRNQQYIKEVQKITSEKERIGAELNVATHIQADMLPSIFPPYPNKTEFDLYASMHPAKEVGGDFYDFFLVDDNHLAMVIADVSGKGVPAALFMVIAKTLLKNRAQMGGTPSEILFDVNNQLCEGNKTEFFVTAWLGIVDVRTGKGLAANAGHEHPALCRAGKKFELVKYRHSPVLAVMENIRFEQHEFSLDKGDKLFVYTDGVVEATDSSNELFGENRMLEALNRNPNASVQGVLGNVKDGINEFVGKAQQFDDITMLCMEYKGSGTSS